MKETGNRLSYIPPVHSAGKTWGTNRLGEGSWLPLGSPGECVGRTCATCLSEASCGTCPPSLAFFGKLRGTLPQSLKCPRPRSSLRVPLAKLFSIGIRLHRRLIRPMFPNDLLHPDHIIPPVKLIPAVLKSPAKTESKVLMELGTVLI